TGGGGLPAPVSCVTDAERAYFRNLIGPASAQPPSAAPARFTFYPLAGTLYGDLFTNNFVDLDPTSGILDWDWTDFTYDGHDATDVLLRTFSEMAIGVPVFAALDGTVLDAHDGEDDMHTVCGGTPNYAVIDHGNGRVCYYLHFKKNSVLVAPGQFV